MAIITIIGAGMMGSAMSVPARDNGHEVRLVGTHLDADIIDTLRETGEHFRMRRKLPDGVSYHQLEDVEAAAAGADLIICGVSSFGVDWFCETILPRLSDGVPVLSVTKGLTLLADGRLEPFPETFAALAPAGSSIPFCAVGGPCTSYELADRHQTCVAFCGEDMDVLLKVRTLLQTEYYHVSLSTDVLGVEAAVALKNAFALAVTMAVGMAEKADGNGCVEHYNTEAALFLQSTREMQRALALLGGRPESLAYGVGDIFVTVFGGRTRLLGTLLGRGLSFECAMEKLPGVTLESVAIAGRIAQSLRQMADRGEAALSDFPLLMYIDALLSAPAPMPVPWDTFSAENGAV